MSIPPRRPPPSPSAALDSHSPSQLIETKLQMTYGSASTHPCPLRPLSIHGLLLIHRLLLVHGLLSIPILLLRVRSILLLLGISLTVTLLIARRFIVSTKLGKEPSDASLLLLLTLWSRRSRLGGWLIRSLLKTRGLRSGRLIIRFGSSTRFIIGRSKRRGCFGRRVPWRRCICWLVIRRAMRNKESASILISMEKGRHTESIDWRDRQELLY